MHAEIIAIGDEITSGSTLDTNSQWLSRRLEELGVRTLYHTTVGDELDPCAAVFRQAIGRADLVVANNVFAHVPDVNDFSRGLAAAVRLSFGLGGSGPSPHLQSRYFSTSSPCHRAALSFSRRSTLGLERSLGRHLTSLYSN